MTKRARKFARGVVLPGLAIVTMTAVTSVTSASADAATKAHGAPIVIGALGSFTGAGSASTASGKTMLQDWISYTNAHGGINGHPVKIFIMDDQNSPSVALANAKQLVDQDHVKAVLDISEDQESTWAPVVDAANVPVIGQAESIVYGSDPNFYSTGTTVVALTWGELKAASLKKVKKVAAFYCAEIASCSQAVPLINAVGKSVGIQLSYSAKVSSTAVSYAAQCLGAKSAGSDGATAVVAGVEGLNLAVDCATEGFKPTWVTTGGEMTTPWLKQSAVNGAIGNVQDVPWFDDSIPATKVMQAAVKKYSPSLLSSSSFGENATQAWAAATVFGAVAKSADFGPNSSSAQLVQALHQVKDDTFGGITPPLTFPAGKSATVPCSFVVGIKNGHWTEPIGLKTVCEPAA
jgi:branched-chain amino acid transport system substrate-binding protein